MQLGQAAPPPPGYFDFCRRSPQACGAAGTDAARGSQGVASPQLSATADVDRRYWSAVLASLRSRSSSRTAWDAAAAAFQSGAAPSDKASPEQPPSTAQPSQDAAAALTEAAQAPSIVAWTPANQRLVNSVNRSVNAAILATPAAFERVSVDLWAAPTLVGADRYGDCKDYALKKREALIAAGIPASALSLAIVRTEQNELHAVLLIATDRGDLALDNRSAWITGWNETGYRWEMRQAAGDPLQWVSIGGPTAPAPQTLAANSAGWELPSGTLVLARNDTAAP